MESMPQKYIELAKHIADKLEDWADPKDETGLRYEYVGYSKPISIAVEGLDELLQWLHHNQPEQANNGDSNRFLANLIITSPAAGRGVFIRRSVWRIYFCGRRYRNYEVQK